MAGLTTNINPTTTNDFRFSYLRNFWQWGTAGATPQLPGLGGALEIGGESAAALIPYNVNTQSVRQRFWDGQDKMIRDDVTKIKGNHMISFGGQYQRNFDYHLRNDNGQGIMNSPVYQITSGGGMTYPSQYRPAAVPSAQISNYNKLYSEVLGIVDQSQDLFTRSGTALNPPAAGIVHVRSEHHPFVQRLLHRHLAHEAQLHSHLRDRLHAGNAALRIERQTGGVDRYQRQAISA